MGLSSPETCNISETMGKIGPRLLLMTNRKSHICTFDWCQNQRPWMTLKGHYALCFKTRVSFGAHHENLNEDRLYYQRRRCRPMTLDSGSMRFMWIFGLILKIYVNFPYILSLHPYITYTRSLPHAFSLSSSIVLFMTAICHYGCGGL